MEHQTIMIFIIGVQASVRKLYHVFSMPNLFPCALTMKNNVISTA